MATQTTRDQTSLEGALYELVARGVKDKYFIEDDKESAHLFQWTYDRYPATLPEIRYTNPLNQPRWGQRCEFEFDLPADVLLEASLSIELPSWLPPEMVAANPTSDTYLTADSDIVYGYVNGIAYFLIEDLEIYQDNILIQKVSGDSLYVSQLTRSNYNQGFLTQRLAGFHDGTRTGIMRNATPGPLKLNIPMIGCSWPGDRGLPLVGLRQQTFRLRLKLRPLERLIETNAEEYNPSPWGKSFTQLQQSGDIITANAIVRDNIPQPLIRLKTKQLYLLNEARQALAKEVVEVPYLRYYDNVFNINQLDYTPLDRGGVSIITERLDANFTVERLLTYFRNTAQVAKNRLWNFSNDFPASVDGQFYNSIQLYIAGQLREGSWGPSVWQNVIVDAKEERSDSRNVAIMNWGLGWRIDDTPPAIREPTGGINFSTADRPTLNINLQNVTRNPTISPPDGYKQVQMFSVCESWALFRVKNGRGALEYAN